MTLEDTVVPKDQRFRGLISLKITPKWLSETKDSFRTVDSEESWGHRALINKRTSRGPSAGERVVTHRTTGAITSDSFHKRFESAKDFVCIVNRARANDRDFIEVHLRGLGIDDLDAIQLAIDLRGNTTVSFIDLGNCNLSWAGAKSLFQTDQQENFARTLGRRKSSDAQNNWRNCIRFLPQAI